MKDSKRTYKDSSAPKDENDTGSEIDSGLDFDPFSLRIETIYERRWHVTSILFWVILAWHSRQQIRCSHVSVERSRTKQQYAYAACSAQSEVTYRDPGQDYARAKAAQEQPRPFCQSTPYSLLWAKWNQKLCLKWRADCLSSRKGQPCQLPHVWVYRHL